MNLYQKGILYIQNACQNPPSPQGYSGKETSGKMHIKQSECSCTLVVGVEKVPYEAQCGGFVASTTFNGLVTT
jgi:hypothetical protein